MKTETIYMRRNQYNKSWGNNKGSADYRIRWPKRIAYLCLPCNYIGPGLYSFRKTKTLLFHNLAKADSVMERSKMTPVDNKLVFSSLFLFVICFAGLIHVEIELYAHRQMLQALSQPKEEKVELKNTDNDEKTNEMIMLFPYSHKGEFKCKTLRTVERPLTKIGWCRSWVKLKKLGSPICNVESFHLKFV